MYQIGTLNKISPVGLSQLSENYSLCEDVTMANGIIVRSQDMHSMDFSEKLMAIARAGAGVNNIPLDKAADAGIVVFNTPGANANGVKELVLAGMFLGARNVYRGIDWAKGLTEDVSKSVEKGKSQFAGTEILGKTLGVIGLGAIGVLTANSAFALGMKVIGFDPYITDTAKANLSSSITIVDSLDDIFKESNFISLHVPAVESTSKMINQQAFAKMKDGVILLNFSRDKLVDDDAIASAVESGKLRAYVTDFPNDKVLNMPGVISIPHLGASTEESEDNCAKMAVAQVMDYLENGNITNSVNFGSCSLEKVLTANSRVCLIAKNLESIGESLSYAISALGGKILAETSSSKGEFSYAIADIVGSVSAEDIQKAVGSSAITVRVI